MKDQFTEKEMPNKPKGETILIAHNELTSSEVINRLYKIIIYDDDIPMYSTTTYDVDSATYDNNRDWDLNYIVWTTCVEICDLPIPLKPVPKIHIPNTLYKPKTKKSFIPKVNRYRKAIRCNRKGIGLRIHNDK